MKPLLLLLFALCAFAQEDNTTTPSGREQARSLVMTKFGIVSTSQTLASQAGAKVLEQGGNAIDAAIAANATLGVVEPAMNGMGGDLFAIIYEAKTGKLYGLNSSGWTPAALTLDLLKQRGVTDANKLGVHRVRSRSSRRMASPPRQIRHDELR
jgi:gamma-glutamyltranspeptidase/glutathione hydrolase